MCNLCKKQLKYIRGSTSSMFYHLHKMHNINPHSESDEAPRSSKSLSITSFFGTQNTIETIVSKLACVDGFSIKAITNSSFIRD